MTLFDINSVNEMDRLRHLHHLQNLSGLNEISNEFSTGISRKFRERPSYEDYTDSELRARFRFGRQNLEKLIEKVNPYLPLYSRRNKALSVENRILITLRVLASGSFLEVVGDHFGVNKSTASRIFDETVKAICQLIPEYISSEFLMRHDSRRWFEENCLPRVIGCVDGTHVKLMAPKAYEEEFVNRKGYHSLNVQVVTTGNLLIADCVAKWPGGTHDSRILSESGICRKFENQEFGDAIILGDEGYPLKQWLFVPVRDHRGLTSSERRFNRTHKKCRSSVERTIGILKQRWSCLKTGLRFSVPKCCRVIMACAVLHNFAKINDEPDPDVTENDGFVDQSSNFSESSDISARHARTLYINSFFV